MLGSVGDLSLGVKRRTAIKHNASKLPSSGGLKTYENYVRHYLYHELASCLIINSSALLANPQNIVLFFVDLYG